MKLMFERMKVDVPVGQLCSMLLVLVFVLLDELYAREGIVVYQYKSRVLGWLWPWSWSVLRLCRYIPGVSSRKRVLRVSVCEMRKSVRARSRATLKKERDVRAVRSLSVCQSTSHSYFRPTS